MRGQTLTEAEFTEGVLLERMLEKAYTPGIGRTPVFHFITSTKVPKPKQKRTKKATKTNPTSSPVANPVSEPVVSKTTQPSGINSLQDGNELLVSTRSTLMLTVNGQELPMPVEVNILLRVAEVTVNAL